MRNEIIFVNATSATSGGTLTILKQFINSIITENNYSKKYYIFVSFNFSEINVPNIFLIDNIKGKKYIDRLVWDIIGMRKWSKNNNIIPTSIISLQNTGVFFSNIEQSIYLHTSIPFVKESNWNPLKKDERKLWFYRYIYKQWIKLSIRKEHQIIVQTQWMRDNLVKEGYNKKKISVIEPEIATIDFSKINKLKGLENLIVMFYPSADYKYKNHRIIIEAVKEIINTSDLNYNFKIIFTLESSSKQYSLVKKYNLEKYFKFVGLIPYEEVLRYYNECDVVLFPSYIETIGLPLIEAKMFNKKILVSDCQYSKEVLREYDKAIYHPFNNLEKWVDSIKKEIVDKY